MGNITAPSGLSNRIGLVRKPLRTFRSDALAATENFRNHNDLERF